MNGELDFIGTLESVQFSPKLTLVLQEYGEEVEGYGQSLFNVSLEQEQDEPHPVLGCSETVTTDLWEGYNLEEALRVFKAFKYFYETIIADFVEEVVATGGKKDV
jgi:hypothetical protein